MFAEKFGSSVVAVEGLLAVEETPNHSMQLLFPYLVLPHHDQTSLAAQAWLFDLDLFLGLPFPLTQYYLKQTHHGLSLISTWVVVAAVYGHWV